MNVHESSIESISVCILNMNLFRRWVFETGRLAPGYDFFRCVVNIPEDVQRVGDPAEDGEQMHVMAGGTSQCCTS